MVLPVANNAAITMTAQGAIDQICIIHTFAETAPDENVFMAKWVIKDGFWHTECQKGDE